MMRTPVFMLLAALFAVLSAAGQAPNLERMDAVQKALPDGPVALVDGAPVTRGDFLFLYHSQCMALASRGKELDEPLRIKIGISTLAELVQREILYQLGERRKLQVSQQEIDKAYAEQMKVLVERFTTKEHTPTEEEILSRSGQKKEGALLDIRKALMVEKTSEALAVEKKISVSDDEAREFFEKYRERFQRPGTLHLKQIYARPGTDAATAKDKDWAEAEKRIRNAAARFKVGDTFEGIAKSMSDGKDKEAGGDMGPRPAGELPPVYVEKAQTMKEGETSEPFKSDYGWHIIRLVGREGGAEVDFATAKDGIKKQLRELKKLATVDEYCKPVMADEERVQIFVELHMPEDKVAEGKP